MSDEEGMVSSVREVSPQLFAATLTLNEVSRRHSGNYSCRPSNAKEASVRLHVIDGNTAVSHAFIGKQEQDRRRRKLPTIGLGLHSWRWDFKVFTYVSCQMYV